MSIGDGTQISSNAVIKSGTIIGKNCRIFQGSVIGEIPQDLKFEGEKTGLIAEGVGAAIGGPGIEKYKIEQNASIYEIPLYAIVVKMSEKEAITEIDNEIENTYDYIIDKIKFLINKYTKENDQIIIAGIGNTLGIK